LENEDELKRLTLHALKELGEIAEVLIKQDRPEHWKKELGDLCGLCIKPMLELAGMDFEGACKIGMDRKLKKMELRGVDKSMAEKQKLIQ
jgi:NTP pyrophosphatase (non-canonical NTP hydrolase)